MLLIKYICLLLISFAPALAWGSSCCGGSVAAPALISGDDKAQLSLSYGRMAIRDDVLPDGRWRSRQDSEGLESWHLEAAHIIRDRWQAGVSVPVIRRSRFDDASTGLGDITANLGYEYLPDWDYNPWRPRGLGFLQVVAPAGRAVFESTEAMQLDTRGRGFWGLGVGTLLTKFWGRWDVLSLFSVRHSFSRASLNPGWGGSLGVGGGYSYKSFRAGANLTWTYEDPIDSEAPQPSKGSAQRFATAALVFSYMPSEEWSGSLSFQDQTLFGAPTNTNLGRGVSLQLQRRWSR